MFALPRRRAGGQYPGLVFGQSRSVFIGSLERKSSALSGSGPPAALNDHEVRLPSLLEVARLVPVRSNIFL